MNRAKALIRYLLWFVAKAVFLVVPTLFVVIIVPGSWALLIKIAIWVVAFAVWFVIWLFILGVLLLMFDSSTQARFRSILYR